MGRGMMGPMGPVMMMRIIFSLMDSDGDATISLPEFQAAHERIFKATDANKDGRLTLEECRPSCRDPRDRFRGSSQRCSNEEIAVSSVSYGSLLCPPVQATTTA